MHHLPHLPRLRRHTLKHLNPVLDILDPLYQTLQPPLRSFNITQQSFWYLCTRNIPQPFIVFAHFGFEKFGLTGDFCSPLR